MVDDNPARLGLEEEVDPAVEHLAVFLDELHGMLDQHAAGGETGVEGRPEPPRAVDCVGWRHGPLPRRGADEGRSPIDRVVTTRVHELSRDDRVERGANLPHVVAVYGDARAHFEYFA